MFGACHSRNGTGCPRGNLRWLVASLNNALGSSSESTEHAGLYPTPSVPRRQRPLWHHQDVFSNPRASHVNRPGWSALGCALTQRRVQLIRVHGTDDRATTLLNVGSHASEVPYRILDAREGRCTMTIFSNLDPTGSDGLTPETLVTCQ